MIAASVVYHDLPRQVSHVTAYAWRHGAAPVPLLVTVTRDDIRIVVSFAVSAPAVPVVIALQRPDGTYLLDGPIAPREQAGDRDVDGVWRRGIAGTAADEGGAPIEWLTDTGVSGAWPSCWWRSATRWECMGVPVDAAGVVMAADGARLAAAVAGGNSTPMLRSSAWGRLVVVTDRGADPPPRVRIAAASPSPPARRARALRLDTAVVADIRVSTVAPGVYWVAGDSSPPEAWLEIRSARSGPQYLPLADVVQAPAQLPLRVALDDRRDIEASVVSGGGEPVRGAFVTVFRLIDAWPAMAARDLPPPRRVLAAEATTTPDGTAALGGLGDADYEVVAWHPQLGRASVRLEKGAARVAIRLQSSGVARGRVLAGGRPAAGVDVFSVPDPAAYQAAADPIDVKGGDARTGADGRFLVALAPGDGGELRVGGGAYPVVRVPLPRAPVPLVELGDVELGQPLSVSIALDQDPGCELRAAGPVGRSGLQIVAAARTGPGLFTMTLPEEGTWELVLICGRTERALAPSLVRISAREGPRDLRLIVR
jgi:hypothetical protein